MSHFTVLVIGSDHEYQLAPFHEYECTGRYDEFVVDVDVTEETLTDFEKHGKGESFSDWYVGWTGGVIIKRNAGEIVDPNSEIAKYSYAIVDDEGDLLKAVRRTNPNAKWDWYQVGGRWNGYFLGKSEVSDLASAGKPGIFGDKAEAGRFDQLLKKDIDIEGMRSQAAEAADEKWNAVRIDEDGKEVSWRTFEDVKAECMVDGKVDYDKARSVYWEQSGVKHASSVAGPFCFSLDGFLVDREVYVNAARNSVLSTYAVVKDRQWYQKGEMGWFGISSDEMTQDEWNEKFMELFDELPDETMLTVVDCHI